MSLAPNLPFTVKPEELYRLSVEQYHSLIASGSLSPEDRIELINGLLVQKMPKNPLHEAVIAIVAELLRSLLPKGWSCRAQGSITLDNSEPEPDLAVFRGRHQDYLDRHPGPGDVAVVVEVADSSLQRDRTNKLSVYARAGIGTYVIVNLTSNVLEVHTQPDSAGGRYRTVQTLGAGETLALSIPGEAAVEVPVGSVLP